MAITTDLDERISSIFKSGSGWVEIERQLGVDRHTVYRALQAQVQIQFGNDIVQLYIKGYTSRMIYRELELKVGFRCGGDTADFIITRYLISLSNELFSHVNEERKAVSGNIYRFTSLDFDGENVRKKHQQGFQLYELANLFGVSISEVKQRLPDIQA